MKITVRLGDISSQKDVPIASIKQSSGSECYSVVLATSGKSIIEESQYPTRHIEVTGIDFMNKETAERVAKAFTYAIPLCKNKKEPF